MKTLPVIATLCLLAASPAWSSGSHDHKPLHGGIVTETKDIDFELVVKPDLLQLYLRDHGKPIDAAKASGKITLLAGTEKQEVTLQSAGNRLEAKGQFKLPAGSKAVATVTVSGKTLTARFVLAK